jgi:2-polyprenyl-3-methyl-5-hydroxy-6-metoxy-1,4-benzoquinol methylase
VVFEVRFSAVTFVWKNHRYVTPEIMDKPDVAAAPHVLALDGLRRINRSSHAAYHLAKPIITMARRRNLNRLSILDIACGGGDVPIGVVTRARNAGIEIDLTLLDRSATALRYAAALADRVGIACQCVQSDCLAQSQPSQFDVVTNSLFLHHILEPIQVVNFLKNVRETATRLVVINDLRRCRDARMGAWIGSRILSRSGIVHHDAPVSAQAAWTVQELAGFAVEAQLDGVGIKRRWPWWMLLVWEAP